MPVAWLLIWFTQGSTRVPEQLLPGGHCCFSTSLVLLLTLQTKPSLHVSQKGCPAASWNLPEGHRVQLGELAALEYCIFGHARQRSLDTPAASASNLPGAHGCLASQYGWPGSVWNLPGGQRSQLCALLKMPNRPASHGAQPRSCVAFGRCAVRSPAMHVACFVHDACPASGWNALLGHAMHAAAFVVTEIVPTAHCRQLRSDIALGAKSSRSPGMQVACFVHDACPASGWNELIGHAMHTAAFVVTEIVPTAHGRQLRSAVAFGSDATRSPLAHAVCGRQKPLPTAGWKVEFSHGSHRAAFSVAEKRPAAHFAHELLPPIPYEPL